MKKILKKVYRKVLILSLESAAREQGLLELANKLSDIIPDISEQYSSFRIENNYLSTKIRFQHAFQVSLAMETIGNCTKSDGTLTVVDIGDSSGTHLQYLKSLCKCPIRTISVNLDPNAVQKIKDKGMEAIEARAELIHEHPEFDGRADIYLSYQMLEHLFDPIQFLRSMATRSDCDCFAVTVPYVKKSRVGLEKICAPDSTTTWNAERTHIFELCPDDWNLIFNFSGWKIVKQIRYTQYPKRNPLSLLRHVWRRYDFDGFYGVILRKDESVSRRYLDW